MTEIVGIPVQTLAPSALLGLVILLLFLGRIWTNPAYQEKVKEANKWQKAYEAESAARALSDAQTAQLLEQGKTTHAIVVAVFENLEKIRESGGTAHVVPLAK